MDSLDSRNFSSYLHSRMYSHSSVSSDDGRWTGERLESEEENREVKTEEAGGRKECRENKNEEGKQEQLRD
ncbi:hypothetical protein E2C01_076881 [Portunus trituberculatus]|uniref:Uncharacterized protein n=1 Tax=Portunus trituberculatus TaxID=210409 RepID=A0A5B7ICX3_PORTR|nr:hypothetical protein [Portunus trituberculatus]